MMWILKKREYHEEDQIDLAVSWGCLVCIFVLVVVVSQLFFRVRKKAFEAFINEYDIHEYITQGILFVYI